MHTIHLELPAPPCPSWCRRPPFHDLGLSDRAAGGVARRIHLGRRRGGVELEQFETSWPDGRVDLGEVRVWSESGAVPVDGLAEVLAEVTS